MEVPLITNYTPSGLLGMLVATQGCRGTPCCLSTLGKTWTSQDRICTGAKQCYLSTV